MTNCRQLSDRMPEVTQGTVRWTPAEERHLARCDDCRLEWDLVRRVARLGLDVDLGVDPAAVADRVLGRVRAAETAMSRRRVWAVGVLAAAASLVLVLWGKVPTVTPRAVAVTEESLAVKPPAATQPSLPVPELDGLNAEQLRMVMESLDQPFRADEVLESSGWGDLESRDLEAGFSS
jgi:hypothetical protein